MVKRSKRYQEAIGLVDREKLYEVDDAIDLLKTLPMAKFDEAVEVAAVQTDRVAGDQLSDVGFRLEPFDRAAHASPPSRLSAQPPGVRPSVRTRREAKRQVPSTRT